MNKVSLQCKHCGFNNPPGMRFCGNCGKQLEAILSLSPTESIQEQLGVMMGRDLLERFKKAGIEATGQRRDVAILFVDLSGFTPLTRKTESEALFDIMQQYIRMLVDVVYRYEGMVDKLTGDGLMALFGAPISHENNAERAVRTAISMQEEMRDLNKKLERQPGDELKIHIGIQAGSVIVGGMGSDQMMNYTAMGDSVNVARRIEEAAPAETIWVSEPVYEQTKEYFDYKPLGSLELKGLDHPLTAYEYAGMKSIPGNVRGLKGLHSIYVGREVELNRVQQAADKLIKKREGSLVLVMGEAGIGKSRLTLEMKSRLPRESCRIYEGRTLTYRKSIPYWIFRDLFQSCLGVTLNSSTEETARILRDRVNQVMPGRVKSNLHYLEHFLSLEISDPEAAETIHYLEAEQLRQRIFRAVRDFLIADSHRLPLVLIFEDLHWADESSIELLSFLLNVVSQEPILIYIISRQFEGKGLDTILSQAKMRFPDRLIQIKLEALQPDQSSQMLFSLLDLVDFPEEFSKQIVQRSAGLPLYLEEILRMLIQKGIVYQDNGTWKVKPTSIEELNKTPQTLQGLILTRFDRLTPQEKRMLCSATVIGYQFQENLLSLMLQDIPESTRESILQKLVEQAFILPEESLPSPRYHFRHALVSDAVYSTILEKDRKNLHALAADSIEKLYSDQIEQQVEILAHHYSRSSRLDRALYYLILSGQKASRGYANEQARQHYEQGLGILPKVDFTIEQALRLHGGLADVLVVIGEYQASRNHYYNALEFLDSDLVNPWNLDRVILYRKIATTFERQGDYEKALSMLQKAQNRTIGEGEKFNPERARILNDIGWIFFRKGSNDQAEDYLLKALQSVDNTTQYDVIASIYNRLGGIAYQKNQFDVTKEYVTKSLVLREKIGDTAAVARSYNNLGLLNWKLGIWDAALDHFRRSSQLQAELGDIEGMIEVDSNLGLLELDCGDVEEAHRHLDEALKNSRNIGHAHHIGFTYLYLTLYHLTVEEWDTALEYSKQSNDILKDLGVEGALVDLYTNTGLIWLGKQNLELAEKWAQEALDLYEKLEKGQAPRQVEDRARGLRLLGIIHYQKNQYKLAQACFDQSEAIFVEAGNLLEQARTIFWKGRVAQENGQTQKAEALIKSARNIFGQLGARLDLQKLESFT